MKAIEEILKALSEEGGKEIRVTILKAGDESER